MNLQIGLNRKIKNGKISEKTLADIAFIFYFVSPFLRVGFGWVLSFLGLDDIAWTCTLVLVYLPFILLLFYRPRNTLLLDCLAVYAFILCFFLVSYLVHPEYEYWYSRSGYGVWDYVFRPDQAIYAYLFVRLMDSQERLLQNMKVAGWIMYVYFIYQVYVASRRGYWVGVTTSGNVEMNYSVSFGYEVMLYTLPFFYCALQERKLADILGTLIGVFLILSYGSRGPLLFLGVFIVLFAMMNLQKTRKKFLIITTVVIVAILVYMYYIPMLTFLEQVMESLGLSSRFITMMLEGTITEDSGRMRIWMAAIEMIQENPLGYGFMGSQHRIANIILAGYPHSLVLEILIDFGVVAGSAILLFIFCNSYAVLFQKRNSDWSGAFLVFVATTCQLFISLCYWSSTAFWVCMAIIMNCHVDKRRKKRQQRLMQG